MARLLKDSGQARRLVALAEIYDGASRGAAARIGGVTIQSIRDWVVRFNAQGPGGLIDGKGQTHFGGFDEKIISLYARGLSRL